MFPPQYTRYGKNVRKQNWLFQKDQFQETDGFRRIEIVLHVGVWFVRIVTKGAHELRYFLIYQNLFAMDTEIETNRRGTSDQFRWNLKRPADSDGFKLYLIFVSDFFGLLPKRRIGILSDLSGFICNGHRNWNELKRYLGSIRIKFEETDELRRIEVIPHICFEFVWIITKGVHELR